MIKNIRKYGLFTVLCMVLMSSQLQAHCQVPCGIYDDSARVKAMLEDSKTISKAIMKIAELSAQDDAQSVNQSVRWVINKEKHAQNIIDTISDYFLTQRVKSTQEDYAERLIKHHTVIVNAMRSKQNVDVNDAEALTDSIASLATYYPQHKH
jgi:nickel superoxide dismutase